MVSSTGILIIDDDPSTIELLTDLLLKAGFSRAMGITTGEGVIGIIKDKKPDIILLDIDIPGEDSTRILNEIKMASPSMPVVILADEEDVKLAEKALGAGASSYIIKSTSASDIVKGVRSEFRRYMEAEHKRKANILIIDDDKDIADMVKNFLEANGYDCSTLQNAAKALEAIEFNKPDLIFLDIVMPNADGIELIQQIKKANKNIKIVMMSGVSDKEICMEAIKRGASGYITKPFSLQQLTVTILTTTLLGG